MVAKESKAKTVDVPKKDKTPKKEKAPKTKKEEEEEDVPETEPVTKQDKKEQKKEKKDKKKSKKDKKSKKEEKEEEKESEEEKETKKDKKKKDKKAKKEEKDEEMTESKEEEEEADNKRKREDDDEESAQDEQPAKAAKSDDEVKPVVYVSRLSYQIQEETLKEFFADCGELANIEWINDSSNKFCGGAVLTFTDMDSVEKALAKNGQEVDGRNAAVDGVKEIPADCTTLFVGGLPKTLVEDDFKQVLADNNISFSSIRFPTDKFTQEYKGIAFIDFETTEQVKAAYHSNLRNVGYMGRCLNYDPSAPRQGGGGGGDRPQGGRGGFGGGRGGRGGFGDRGGRGGRGGFGGGRGGRGGFGDRGGRGGRGGFGGRGGGGRGGFGGRKTTFDE